MDGEGSRKSSRLKSAAPLPRTSRSNSVLPTFMWGTNPTGAKALSTMRQKEGKAGKKTSKGAINAKPESSA
eukprot:2746556-Pyramimonas_sp.AAC.1